jgi:tetratricopeptide (TPR) repeat protein
VLGYILLGARVGLSQVETAETPDTAIPELGAEQLFREGRRALADGDTETACARFEQSLELKRSPGILLNLGTCSLARGDLVAALAIFSESLFVANQEPDAAKRGPWVGAAEAQIRSLEARVPAAFVRVEAGTRALIAVDGRRLDSITAPLLLNPGTHQLAVSFPDLGLAYERPFALAEGQRIELVITRAAALANQAPSPSSTMPPNVAPPLAITPPEAQLRAPLAPSVAPAPLAVAPALPWPTILGWSLLGGAGASAITGGVIGWLARSDSHRLERRCSEPDVLTGKRACYGERNAELLSRARQRAATADGLLLGSAIGAGLGLVGLWWGASASDANPEPSVASACQLEGCTVTLRMRY